jgi:hypothetical protein
MSTIPSWVHKPGCSGASVSARRSVVIAAAVSPAIHWVCATLGSSPVSGDTPSEALANTRAAQVHCWCLQSKSDSSTKTSAGGGMNETIQPSTMVTASVGRSSIKAVCMRSMVRGLEMDKEIKTLKNTVTEPLKLPLGKSP